VTEARIERGGDKKNILPEKTNMVARGCILGKPDRVRRFPKSEKGEEKGILRMTGCPRVARVRTSRSMNLPQRGSEEVREGESIR